MEQLSIFDAIAEQPPIEYSRLIAPRQPVHTFESEEDEVQHLKECGLLPKTAKKPKQYLYKRFSIENPLTCKVVGYIHKHGVVIEFSGGYQEAIHPAFLKSMQSATFGIEKEEQEDE